LIYQLHVVGHRHAAAVLIAAGARDLRMYGVGQGKLAVARIADIHQTSVQGHVVEIAVDR